MDGMPNFVGIEAMTGGFDQGGRMSILHVDLNSFMRTARCSAARGNIRLIPPYSWRGPPEAPRHSACGHLSCKGYGSICRHDAEHGSGAMPRSDCGKADFNAYMRYSSLFMRIIQDYSPLITRYGIDEAYLDYRGCEHLWETPSK